MKTTILAGLLAVVGICVVAPNAQAEPTKKDDQYGYVFEEDALQAKGNNANIDHVRGLRRAVSDRLIRPRMHFVAEMLKSVENM